MSKNILAITTTILTSIIIAGCSGRGDIKQWGAGVDEDKCYFPDRIEEPAPGWVCTEAWENVSISAVGSYQETKGGVDFQKAMAMTIARERIAARADLHVRSLIKRYASASTDGSSETFNELDAIISNNITKASLPGTQLYRMTINPETKRMYVLVGLNENFTREYVRSVLQVLPAEELNRHSLNKELMEQSLMDEIGKIGEAQVKSN